MDTDRKLMQIIEETSERYKETLNRLAAGEDRDSDAKSPMEESMSEGEE